MHELKCTLFNSADIMHESNLFQGNTSKNLSKLSSWYHIPMPGLSYAHSQSNDIICILHEAQFISEKCVFKDFSTWQKKLLVTKSFRPLEMYLCMHNQLINKNNFRKRLIYKDLFNINLKKFI